MTSLDQLRGQRLGLAAGGAVADRDDADLVELHQTRQHLARLGCVVLRRMRVDRHRVQQLAGGIDRRHLAAGAKAGIDAHHRPLAQRRLEQQVAQVRREDRDGVVVAELAQLAAHLALDRRAQQPLVAVLDGQAHLFGGFGSRRLDPRGLDAAK